MGSAEKANAGVRGSALEVLGVFLLLGCTSFGGPVAHMGYFRREFVERRRWVSEATYAELIAIAHALPGPGSSQVGFAVGMLRAGWWGGVAAWFGFTLPSAVLMTAIALGEQQWTGPAGSRVFHGLQLVAVAVVAQAVVAMQRSLAPDGKRMVVAALAAVTVLFVPWTLVNLLVILLAGLAGVLLFRGIVMEEPTAEAMAMPKVSGVVAAVLFAGLLVPALLLTQASLSVGAVGAAFYRSGALVFGGGHVVLPLLERSFVDRGWVAQRVFLAGYGAAQAMPGPLFSFSSYVGAAVAPVGETVGYVLVSVVCMFAPGLLLMAAVLPFWGAVRTNRALRAALLAVNGSVVGILAAALIHPLWTSAVHTIADAGLAVAAFAALLVPRVQPWMVVLGVVAVSLLLR